MNDVYDLLIKLKNLGARIYSVDDKIKLDIEPGLLNSEISDKIKHYRKDILSLLNSNKKSDFLKIEKLPPQESYALSDDQRRLWILNQFKGSSTAYRISGNLYLDSMVNVESVKKSLWSVLERHESLRTVYREDDSGELRQWILSVEDSGFNIDYQDFRNEQNKIELVKSYLGKISREKFDLENGPLLKVSLIRLEDEDYVIYYDVHQINTDGWSMTVFFNDLNKFYDAYQAGQTPDIAPLKFQYKDYSAWQLKMLEDESSDSDRTYWLESLNGEITRLDLPSYKPRPKVLTYSGEAYKGSIIGTRTITRLKEYSEENGGSLFMGLFAAWNVLMYRYTSQEDIIIGTPLNSREHADTQDQIGFYGNTLAIRNKLSPEENFNSVFNKVKQSMLDAYSHQLYPFNRLVEELNLPKDASRNTVFDIMLVFNSSDKKSDSSSGDDQSSQMIQVGNTTSRFDLEVGFREMDNYIQVWGVYNPDVYEEEIVEELIRHYKQLLNSLLENTEEKISTIDYLSEDEKHELLFTFNDTDVEYSKDKTIVDLFEEQVAKTPYNIAIVFEDKELTYQELNERSNQLAHYLQDNYTIQPDDLVGIKIDRSEWMIISILGVLKSGGAYVPIDPESPQAIIDYIENDINCKVCIDENELSKFEENKSNYSKQPVPFFTNEESLACVIYTPCSTGKPKGVMIEHKSMCNLCTWHQQEYGVNSTSRATLFSGAEFEASVWELFSCITSGGSVCPIPNKHRSNATKLVDMFNKFKITHAFMPTILVKEFVVKSDDLTQEIKLRVGGEALLAYKKTEKIKLFNNYGPTENTVVTTNYQVREEGSGTIPIGKPISNNKIYILNEKEELQPIGVIGEICISGLGLARGYLNQPKLTQEKFIANPFKGGERLYKTGDLGRWLPDGNIEFIGRKDVHVKVRGHPIEFGEIEHALLKHEEINQAVVLAQENQSGEKELVAYITAKSEQNISDLRSYLKKTLPAYMLPTYFEQLEAMPLTANGEVDKKSLRSKSLSNEKNLLFVLPLQYARYQNYKSGPQKKWNFVIKRDLKNADEKALSMAVDTLVARHESLRILFLEREGKVLQKIYDVEKFVPNLLIEDLSADEDKVEKIKSRAANLSNHLFDFQNEQSFKCKLIKFERDEHFFIFVIDHIIYDAHSLKIIEEELFTLYNSYSKGLPNPLEPLRVHLRDYLFYFRKHYVGTNLVYHQSYFKNLFKDLPKKLRIKSFFSQPEIEHSKQQGNSVLSKESEAGGYMFIISEEILDKIQIMRSEQKISFFNFMLASYSVFLNRISDQNDFMIDSPMSTRTNLGFSKLIGWLTGTLVTRVKVDNDVSFEDLLKLCNNIFMEAIDHIYYQSSEDVLSPEWFHVATQLNILNDISTPEGKLVDFHPHHFDVENTTFDLGFHIKVYENGMVVNCSYKKNFILKSEISQICEIFISVLKTAVNSRDIKIKNWIEGQ